LAQVRNRKIGFVFQNFYLMPRMTALDNVAQPLIYRGVSPALRRARAAEAFHRSAQLPSASQYVHRFALYQLALVPGREAEAYAELKALYQKSEQEHLPTLLRRLQDLEKKLSVPPDQRLPIPESR
jgi:ABC-type sugar transport system ATPase subunit